MKSISTVWLRVCLYSVLSLSAAATLVWLSVRLNSVLGPGATATSSTASLANGAAADVPPANRSTSSDSLSDMEILERARSANEDVYASLQSFVCKEEVNRFRGNVKSQVAQPLDTVTARVSFEGGREQYTNVTQNASPKAGMSSLSGAWSQGEFGTLLLQTQQLLATQKVAFEGYANSQGEPAAVYHFDVAAEASPWRFSMSGHHYLLPFRTRVWISVGTGEILRIERSTTAVAAEAHVAEVRWGITLDRVDLNGKTWLLPATGNYAIVYSQSIRDENQISFTGYQRYSSPTTLNF